MPWTLVLTCGSGPGPGSRNASSRPDRVPALPEAWACRAAWRVASLRPGALVIAACVSRRSKRLWNAASWIALASWWAVRTWARSTSVRAGVVIGMICGSSCLACRGAGRDGPGIPCGRGVARHEDVDPVVAAPPHLPVDRRGQVAQHRTVAGGQDGGHPAALAGEPVMAHGVNGAVKGVEPTGRDALREIAESSSPAARSCALVITPCWRPATAAIRGVNTGWTTFPLPPGRGSLATP